MKSLCLSICLILFCICAQADNDSSKAANYKEVCISSNGLLRQFVPFNLSAEPNELSSLRFKWYGKKYAFRTSLGLHVKDGQINRNFFSLGFERRKDLYKKFTYTSGWDYFILLSSNDPNTRVTSVSIGPSKFYGIEYNINNRLFLGTEAHIMLGIGEPLRIITQTPTSIFACLRL